ncbi:uncharacterized protein MELLADRAFT_104451 [Melampsora larici-populina 98AG31]|uniref:Secreted protein n=1 Tax=Melampsora larici-populina (strain 98AG31 / pathotype 3-4-7) TaxID=747676 RepID=F4RER0_MELLP|nr:uncharacterized protein MELLADRAFT_104451 [Melampsora larici-populina 98AG31]EGG09142.1 secreted protein [Melampsora larici-populina 98AG31]
MNTLVLSVLRLSLTELINIRWTRPIEESLRHNHSPVKCVAVDTPWNFEVLFLCVSPKMAPPTEIVCRCGRCLMSTFRAKGVVQQGRIWRPKSQAYKNHRDALKKPPVLEQTTSADYNATNTDLQDHRVQHESTNKLSHLDIAYLTNSHQQPRDRSLNHFPEVWAGETIDSSMYQS